MLLNWMQECMNILSTYLSMNKYAAHRSVEVYPAIYFSAALVSEKV